MNITSTVEEFSQIGIGFPKRKYKKESKVKQWGAVRKELKKEFAEAGITACEIGLIGCTYKWYLSFAHTVKRRYVKDLKRVVLACLNCHHKVEYECEKWTGKTMEEYLEGIIASRIT